MTKTDRLIFGWSAVSATLGLLLWLLAWLAARKFAAEHPGATYDYVLPWAVAALLIRSPCVAVGSNLALSRRPFHQWLRLLGWLLLAIAVTPPLFVLSTIVKG